MMGEFVIELRSFMTRKKATDADPEEEDAEPAVHLKNMVLRSNRLGSQHPCVMHTRRTKAVLMEEPAL
eukprot:751759-Amphidinium_carterae.1